ncbi:tubulin polyglutamylase TTLL5-like isoform X3 [Pomacea canaliculata]|uniref:tubulin polyglutamylase TTLL5-like isoform X3 n=1 Tax=Pomacea canaliculata TaxID=400727 RepID=UPI000D727C47|nr:tubulin polyglutamylase TTLL5-like isoform X3 [Pomacea canaliculata]
MASRATDSSGGGSLTPSEQSGEERSDHDSDYETDDGEQEEENARDKNFNIMWTGYGKRTPVILFNSNCILHKKTDLKAIGERYHLAFKFGTSDCKIIRTILHSHGFHEVHPNSQDFNLMWTNAHLKPFTLRLLTEFQKINHFPRSYELTRKDRLFKNIQRMQQIKGARHFDFVPQSYVLPTEYQDFCTYFLKDRGPWIVKPVASSRGRGVFLVNHPDQVPLDENLIVCRYIDNPLVIDGFKFDIRLYVAVTCYDPLVIYLYEEGLTRFATVKYEKSFRHLRNQCMHLTNYSINKKSRDYVKNDDPDVEDYGNKWSMGAMLRYLRSLGKDTTALMMKIEDAVIKTILSVELSIATACKMFMPFRGNCFELYGFDILVDESFKPWVLEVNLSPSLACDSPLDLKIKGNMLCDLFSLVGIVCHDPLTKNMIPQCHRNQETASKISARTKSAFTRPVSARMSPPVLKNRPLSASSSAKTLSGPSWAGLNSEEIKILRRIKEEEQRQEGWIRIFPGPDTWDIYGSFLQFNTTHNLMLHQRLYPERHKMCLKMTAPAVSSAIARSKNASQHISNASHTNSKLDLEKTVDAYSQALVRARKYERKLGSRSQKPKTKSHKKGRACRKIQLVQGVAEDEEDMENQSCEEEEGETRSRQGEEEEKKKDSEDREVKPGLQESTEVKVQELHTQEVKVDLPPAPPQSLPPPPAEPRYNVVELLVKGVTLTKMQARSAFAAYLLCVQHRLISETGPLLQEDVDALNEQMDLVLRFLKRAAVNLQQTFRVCVPSRKLPLGDRRRILAKQLGDFVHIYNKETGQFKDMETLNKQSVSVDPRISEYENKLNESKFDHFVSTASEAELEEVLTTYTKLNKSASIFLGSSSKQPSHNTSKSGSDDKTSCTLEIMLPDPDTQSQQHSAHSAAEGDSKCHTRPPGSGEDYAENRSGIPLRSPQDMHKHHLPSTVLCPSTHRRYSDPAQPTYTSLQNAVSALNLNRLLGQYLDLLLHFQSVPLTPQWSQLLTPTMNKQFRKLCIDWPSGNKHDSTPPSTVPAL